MAEKKDKQDKKQTLGHFWLEELKTAHRAFEKWEERSRRIIRRYRDERDAVENRTRRFNILWSNVQVLKPALYGQMPKPEVTRRYKDSDPTGRVAAMMLERCLEFDVEQYADFDAAMSGAVEDRLLVGRGISWVRYESNEADEPILSEDVDATVPRVDFETAPTDYVHWQDFAHTPARTWEEVWWVARRVYMTRAEGEKRFGDAFNAVPIQHDEKPMKDTETPKDALKKKAEVWEIWDKTEKQVIWVAKGYDRELDVRPDPLQLEGFFPCPKPLFATVTTGSTVPVPDYVEYQDQAEELDIITQRIARLVKGLKTVGVYNAEYPAIKRMLNEGFDNDLVPVDAWAAFAEKGGMEGAIQLLPIKDTMEVLKGLYESREQVKQTIYEVVGISDILRGSTESDETLGAQQLKAQFGSMRMKTSQKDVARYATDLLRFKSQIICRFFSDETILKMSGIQGTLDGQNPQLVMAALQLLRGGPLKDFRVEVAADTLAQIDEQQEKAEAFEFVTSIGALLKEAVPFIQMAPAAAPMVGELVMFSVRKMKAGRTLEAAFEKSIQALGAAMQQGGMNPQQIEEAKAQIEQKAAELQKQEMDLQRKGFELEMKSEKVAMEEQMAVERIGMETERHRFAVERDKEAAVMDIRRQQDQAAMVFAEREQQAEVAAAQRDLKLQGKEQKLKAQQKAAKEQRAA